jgi:hypothetical protein
MPPQKRRPHLVKCGPGNSSCLDGIDCSEYPTKSTPNQEAISRLPPAPHRAFAPPLAGARRSICTLVAFNRRGAAMTSHLPPLVEKLIPRLASNFDGEVVATARAIDRSLRANGRDWHDVARGSEPPPPPRPRRAPRMPAAGGRFARRAWYRHCRFETLAELQRYQSNNAVALRCLTCNMAVRQGGKLFWPHNELRAMGIDPSALPEVCGDE